MNNYNELSAAILARYDSLSNQLQRVARFALRYPDVMGTATISALAEKISVQQSTITRFAQAFGLEGFRSLKRICRSAQVGIKSAAASASADLTGSGDAVGETPQRAIQVFTEAGVNALQRLSGSFSAESLKRATSILVDAQTIHVMSQPHAFPVAVCLYFGIVRGGRPARLINGVGSLYDQQARQMRTGDALIIISDASPPAEILDVMDRAIERRIPIVRITDSGVGAAPGPLSPNATVSFDIDEGEAMGMRSLTASLCLVMALVAGIEHADHRPTSLAGRQGKAVSPTTKRVRHSSSAARKPELPNVKAWADVGGYDQVA